MINRISKEHSNYEELLVENEKIIQNFSKRKKTDFSQPDLVLGEEPELTYFKFVTETDKLLIANIEIVDISKVVSFANTIREKEKTLEQLIRVFGHDLKSPVVNIRNYVNDILLDLDENEIDVNQIVKDLNIIKTQANKLTARIDALSRLAQIDDAAYKLEPVNLNTIISRVQQLLIPKNDLTIINVDNRLPTIRGIRTYIELVFQNLIQNSMKYKDVDRSPLKINIGSKLLNDGMIEVYVRDNGIGIDPNFGSKIFDLFATAGNNKNGFGIGLATVVRIMNFHNGKITYKNNKEFGTTFNLTFNRNLNKRKE